MFAGDLSEDATTQRLQKLGDRLEDTASILHMSEIEPILVHASPRQQIELTDVTRPFYCCESQSQQGDYHRVMADDVSYHHGHGRAYASYGVDKARGQSELVRPDQYFAWVGAVDDSEDLETFLAERFR